MKIVQFPHPALRFSSRPLTVVDREVRLVAGRMLELMHEANGLGLAANQVAWPFQMFVINPDPKTTEHEQVLINPVILERKGTLEGDEGCLSFPELFQKVRRAKSIKLQAYDLEGRSVEIVTSQLPQPIAELASRVLQHELDHLHGVLFIDKMGPLGKLGARSLLREFERKYRKAQDRGELASDADLERILREMADLPPKAPQELQPPQALETPIEPAPEAAETPSVPRI